MPISTLQGIIENIEGVKDDLALQVILYHISVKNLLSKESLHVTVVA